MMRRFSFANAPCARCRACTPCFPREEVMKLKYLAAISALLLAVPAQASAEIVNINLRGVVLMTTRSCDDLDHTHHSWTTLPDSSGNYVRGVSGAETGGATGGATNGNMITSDQLPTQIGTLVLEQMYWGGNSQEPDPG